jgi:hypothetical protein
MSIAREAAVVAAKNPMANLMLKSVPGNRILAKIHLLATESEAVYRVFGNASLPSAEDVLHFTGYPRSGNTYGAKLIVAWFGNLPLVTHIHRAASVKAALRVGMPILVVLRDPEQCISSYVVKRHAAGASLEAAVSYAIAHYNRYHRYVSHVGSRVRIVPFELMVEKPHHFLSLVAHLLDRDLLITERSVLPVAASVKAQLERRPEGGRAPEMRNMSNDAKQRAKTEVLGMLRDRSDFAVAKRLYSRLLGLSSARS